MRIENKKEKIDTWVWNSIRTNTNEIGYSLWNYIWNRVRDYVSDNIEDEIKDKIDACLRGIRHEN